MRQRDRLRHKVKWQFPVAQVVALADGISIVALISGYPTLAFQATALVVKILIVPFFLYRDNIFRGGMLLIASFLAIILTSGAFAPYGSLEGEIRLIVTLVHITSSLLLLRRDSIETYTSWFGYLVAGANALYITLVMVGNIPDHFGRYYYLSDGHPNLGSEIAAIGAVASLASSSVSFRMAFLSSAVNFTAVVLMQGRAAMLAIALSVMIRAGIEFSAQIRRNGVFFGSVAILGATAVLISSFTLLKNEASALLMLDDEYRGVSTGFVGRDERWVNGVRLFYDSPLVGGGPDAFNIMQIESPHNFYLYGLGEFGIMFLIILWVLGSTAFNAFKYNPRPVAVMIPLLILTVFNDRFLNLNPYPAVAYILLSAYAAFPLRTNSAQHSLAIPRSARPGGVGMPRHVEL